MKKIEQLPDDINDIPVIFVRNPSGEIAEKISINELKKRNYTQDEENHRIQLYRAAVEHYVNANYELAELLLLRLIESSDVTNYEYYERLANVYRAQNLLSQEIEVLETARRLLKEANAPEGLILRVERRLNKSNQSYSMIKASIEGEFRTDC